MCAGVLTWCEIPVCSQFDCKSSTDEHGGDALGERRGESGTSLPQTDPGCDGTNRLPLNQNVFTVTCDFSQGINVKTKGLEIDLRRL